MPRSNFFRPSTQWSTAPGSNIQRRETRFSPQTGGYQGLGNLGNFGLNAYWAGAQVLARRRFTGAREPDRRNLGRGVKKPEP
jgi:hypothetical protein